MIAAALKGEVEEYVASFVDEVDEDGKRLLVRNGRRACTAPHDRVGNRADPGAAHQRQAHRRGDRRAQAV
jgi:hypothetical protein